MMVTAKLDKRLNVVLEFSGMEVTISEENAKGLCYQLGICLLEQDREWIELMQEDTDFSNHHIEDVVGT